MRLSVLHGRPQRVRGDGGAFAVAVTAVASVDPWTEWRRIAKSVIMTAGTLPQPGWALGCAACDDVVFVFGSESSREHLSGGMFSVRVRRYVNGYV